jgi:hypothetical protein
VCSLIVGETSPLHSLALKPGVLIEERQHDITNRETAKLVSDTLQRIRDDLREIRHSVEAGCQPQEFAAYNKALSRILHHFDADILEPIYRAHPDLSAQAK